MIHTAYDVLTYGPLDNCSAFKYENFMQFFKKYIRKGNQPLQQIIKRISEINVSDVWFGKSVQDSSSIQFLGPHSNGPVIDSCHFSRQYKRVVFSSFKLSQTQADSFCYLKYGSIVQFKNIIFSFPHNSMVILCKKFRFKQSFLNIPEFIDMAKLGVFLVHIEGEMVVEPIPNILCKAYLVHIPRNQNVAYPLL